MLCFLGSASFNKISAKLILPSTGSSVAAGKYVQKVIDTAHIIFSLKVASFHINEKSKVFLSEKGGRLI